MENKISIRFYKDSQVRAIWGEEQNKWFFSVLDVIGAINEQDDYEKTRNYWKYLKAKLKKENSELVSVTTQLKLKAADGKRYNTDVLDANGVELLAKNIPNGKAMAFLDWFTYSDNSIDGQSRKKAYLLAMHESTTNAGHIKTLLRQAMTDRIDDREIFMKGIDYSYYYEQVE